MALIPAASLSPEELAVHEGYMREALSYTKTAYDQLEVTIGCVIVHNAKIIAKGWNLTNQLNDATRHAELVAIDEYLKEHPNDYKTLKESTLYVTCEPCIMCASALRMAGIGLVVYGCSNERFGGCRSVFKMNGSDCLNKLDSYDCIYGVLENEAIEVLKQFYGRPNPFTSEGGLNQCDMLC